MKRIVTDRYQQALDMTSKSNEYISKHPEVHLPRIGPPINPDIASNLEQIRQELYVDSQFAHSIYKLCIDCIYFDTINRNEEGSLSCKYIKNYFFNKAVQEQHCRMRKTSISDLSEFEQYIEKQKKRKS